jgi:hypothetical protein
MSPATLRPRANLAGVLVMTRFTARNVTIAAVLCAGFTFAEAGRRDPFAFLSPDIVVAPSDRARLDAGQTLVRVLSGRDGLLSLMAIVRMNTSADRVLAWSRSVETLQKGKYVPEIGRFSLPPDVEDLQGLTIDSEDVDALEQCRPGHCGLKLSDTEIARLQAAQSRAQLDALFRRFLTERATDYATGGDAEALPYHDHSAPVRPQDAFAAVLQRLEFFPRNLACYAEYLRRYPQLPATEVRESFLYWSKERLGMKPIISITHFSATRFATPGLPEVAVVAKQVYATHYRDAALTMTALTGDADSKYLVYVHRSHVDAFGGVFGGVLRRMVERRVKAEAPGVLLDFRKRLESGEPPNRAVQSK